MNDTVTALNRVEIVAFKGYSSPCFDNNLSIYVFNFYLSYLQNTSAFRTFCCFKYIQIEECYFVALIIQLHLILQNSID